jgi:hypothetical protein
MEIKVRRASEEGLGELIATCPIRGWDKRYNSPQVDVELPEDFELPKEPIHVHLYFGDTLFGHLILGPTGFESVPEARHESPYFKVEVAEPEVDNIVIWSPPACVLCDDRAFTTACGHPVCSRCEGLYMEEAKKYLPDDQRPVWQAIVQADRKKADQLREGDG